MPLRRDLDILAVMEERTSAFWQAPTTFRLYSPSRPGALPDPVPPKAPSYP